MGSCLAFHSGGRRPGHEALHGAVRPNAQAALDEARRAGTHPRTDRQDGARHGATGRRTHGEGTRTPARPLPARHHAGAADVRDSAPAPRSRRTRRSCGGPSRTRPDVDRGSRRFQQAPTGQRRDRRWRSPSPPLASPRQRATRRPPSPSPKPNGWRCKTTSAPSPCSKKRRRSKTEPSPPANCQRRSFASAWRTSPLAAAFPAKG